MLRQIRSQFALLSSYKYHADPGTWCKWSNHQFHCADGLTCAVCAQKVCHTCVFFVDLRVLYLVVYRDAGVWSENIMFGVLVWADGHFLVVGGTYLSLKPNRVPPAMKAKRVNTSHWWFSWRLFMIGSTKEVFFGEELFAAWWPQNPHDTPRNETESTLKPAQIRVTLPSGYLCTVVGNGTADPLGEKTFFKHLGKNWREIAGIISYRLN